MQLTTRKEIIESAQTIAKGLLEHADTVEKVLHKRKSRVWNRGEIRKKMIPIEHQVIKDVQSAKDPENPGKALYGNSEKREIAQQARLRNHPKYNELQDQLAEIESNDNEEKVQLEVAEIKFKALRAIAGMIPAIAPMAEADIETAFEEVESFVEKAAERYP